jgi:hypothetical protein
LGWGGGWALVPVFNLAMGVPLRVACSEVAITLGDAAAVHLSAGFRLFGFDAGGNRVGGFSGGAGCGVGEDRAAGGFASRRGYAVTCRRLYGGVLLTAAAGFQSWARRGLACGFLPGRRCVVTGVAVFFALFLAASAAGSLRWAGCAARSPELPRWLAVQRLGAGVTPACGAACVKDDLSAPRLV